MANNRQIKYIGYNYTNPCSWQVTITCFETSESKMTVATIEPLTGTPLVKDETIDLGFKVGEEITQQQVIDGLTSNNNSIEVDKFIDEQRIDIWD